MADNIQRVFSKSAQFVKVRDPFPSSSSAVFSVHGDQAIENFANTFTSTRVQSEEDFQRIAPNFFNFSRACLCFFVYGYLSLCSFC